MQELTNYTLICKVSEELFAGYRGVVEKQENRVSITAKNDLGEKKVECEVYIGVLNSLQYPFCVNASEKTYQILGGNGTPCKTLEEVEKVAKDMLEKYHFEKETKQISMFDLIEKAEEEKMKFKIMLKEVHHLMTREDYENNIEICEIKAKDMEEAKEIAMRVLTKGSYPKGKKDTGGDNYIEYKYRVEEVKQ